jgi:lipid A oxidase
MGRTRLTTISLILAASLAPFTARAESEFSVYLGFQEASHSRVEGDDGAGNDFSFLAAWEGRSFQMPPYWGLRGTYWVDGWRERPDGQRNAPFRYGS